MPNNVIVVDSSDASQLPSILRGGRSPPVTFYQYLETNRFTFFNEFQEVLKQYWLVPGQNISSLPPSEPHDLDTFFRLLSKRSGSGVLRTIIKNQRADCIAWLTHPALQHVNVTSPSIFLSAVAHHSLYINTEPGRFLLLCGVPPHMPPYKPPSGDPKTVNMMFTPLRFTRPLPTHDRWRVFATGSVWGDVHAFTRAVPHPAMRPMMQCAFSLVNEPRKMARLSRGLAAAIAHVPTFPVCGIQSRVPRLLSNCVVTHCVLKLFPPTALGRGNVPIIKEYCRALTTSGSRHAQPPLSEWVNRLKLSTIAGAPRPLVGAAHAQYHQAAHRLLQFIIEHAFVAAIRASTYVTDCGVPGQLVFAPIEVWTPQERSATETLINKGHFVTDRSPAPAPPSLKLRLLPRTDGRLRPIINMSGRPGARSINGRLQPLHQYLTNMAAADPTLFGAGVPGLADAQRRLHRFTPNGSGLYLVACDVARAFDSMSLGRVTELVAGIVNKGPAGLYLDRQLKQSPAGVRIRLRGNAAPSQLGWVSIPTTTKDAPAAAMLLAELAQPIATVIGRVRPCGIPQGSAVSTDLCNLYLGSLEQVHLAALNDVGSLFIRLVDDWLLVTPKKHLAEWFARRAGLGFPDYGVTVGAEKMQVAGPGEAVTWCGLTIQSHSDISGLSVRRAARAFSGARATFTVQAALQRAVRHAALHATPLLASEEDAVPGLVAECFDYCLYVACRARCRPTPPTIAKMLRAVAAAVSVRVGWTRTDVWRVGLTISQAWGVTAAGLTIERITRPMLCD